MKYIAVLFLFLLAPLVVSAQQDSPSTEGEPQEMPSDAPWRLVIYPPEELENAAADISGIVAEGFLPVGLEIEPDGDTAVLFVQAGETEVEGWVITDYLDWNQLEAQVTATIREGFVPMDISRYGDAIAILWVRTEIPVAGWRIHADENTLESRIDTINRFQEQDFSLWGVSEHQGLMWYLFLRREDGVRTAGAIESYDKELPKIRAGISDSAQDSWLPNGLAVSEDSFIFGFMR